MAVNFPDNPVHGQIFGTWTYDSTVPGWRSTPDVGSGMPAGSIMAWGTDTPPTNWLICNGSAISRSTYASLFAAIGVLYGAGDGTTTFNLPDLRGKVPMGKDATQAEFLNVSQTGGYKTTAKYGDGTTAGYGQTYSSSLGSGDTTGSNLPPYQVVNYIIKYSAGVSAGDSELATRVGVTETVNAAQNTRLTNLEASSYNYIINGAMDIWQRGVGPVSAGNGGYTAADRWYVYNNAVPTTTVAKETTIVPPGFTSSYKLTQTTTSTAVYLMQSNETAHTAALEGKTVTLSAYVYGAVATTFSLGLRYDTTTVDKTPATGYTGTVATTSTAVGAATWARITATGVVPVGTKTLRTDVYVASPTLGQPFYITGVQLEEGPVATVFHRNAPSVQAELAVCQRYYRKATTYAAGGTGGTGGDAWIVAVQFPVPMRTGPTVAWISGGTAMDGTTDKPITGLYGTPYRNSTTDGVEVLYKGSTAFAGSARPVTVREALTEFNAEL